MMVPCDVRNLLALHVFRIYYEELVNCVRPTPLLHAWKSSEAPFLMMQLAIQITVLRHDHVQYPPSLAAVVSGPHVADVECRMAAEFI